jgi:multiple sugar transport system ATP-binding protein
MNFIKSEIGGTVTAPSISMGKGKVALKTYAAKGKLKICQVVVFGARPEHLRLSADNEPGLSDAFDATVDLIEPMGSDSLVWLKLADQILSARVESSQIYKPNENITVRFHVGPASLFDSESGERP